jgi:hypothetical protein
MCTSTGYLVPGLYIRNYKNEKNLICSIVFDKHDKCDQVKQTKPYNTTMESYEGTRRGVMCIEKHRSKQKKEICYDGKGYMFEWERDSMFCVWCGGESRPHYTPTSLIPWGHLTYKYLFIQSIPLPFYSSKSLAIRYPSDLRVVDPIERDTLPLSYAASAPR